jgi:Rod binding domain-containing protein
MSPTAIHSIAPRTATPAGEVKIQKAAQDFEALLIEQILKSAHAGEDQSASALSEMAEQQFAQMLASSGGLGLATFVKTGLSTRQP